MTLTIDSTAYNSLLTKISPKVIDSQSEYERALSIIEKLMFNNSRTSEETAIYLLLVTLVEAYEAEYSPMPKPSPDSILRHILEASGTQPSALVGTIGSHDEVIEIVSGKQTISEAQANILAERFNVSASLFQ
ncbi:MAG: transcriptional regulator [Cyanobacteria bacterium J06627_28]